MEELGTDQTEPQSIQVVVQGTIQGQGAQPTVLYNGSAEKNTKGYNWSATVLNARSSEELVDLLKAATNRQEAEYGNGVWLSRGQILELEQQFPGIAARLLE